MEERRFQRRVDVQNMFRALAPVGVLARCENPGAKKPESFFYADAAINRRSSTVAQARLRRSSRASPTRVLAAVLWDLLPVELSSRLTLFCYLRLSRRRGEILF